MKKQAERVGKGQEIYVNSMEMSALDKARVFPYVKPDIKPGIIVDMGAAAGAVTALLADRFSGSEILAVDNSVDMIARLGQRFVGTPNVEVIKANVPTFSYLKKVDTILYISVLHEIFSSAGYSHQAVIDTLQNAYQLLKDGGRVIIRDGVQPEQRVLYLRPKHERSYKRFHRFVVDFKVRPIVFTQGTFHNDIFVQHEPRDFTEFEQDNFLIEMASQDVSELLSKYFYPEINWKAELVEQFGIWTLREYQHIFLELGFVIVYAKTYVLPYLLETHYSKDFEVFELANGQLARAPYPPSTMILVGEK